jgi:alpha-beta hydrolase superfamily lysophospholipase
MVRARPPRRNARALLALAAAATLALAGCLPLPDVRRPSPASPPTYRVEPRRVPAELTRMPGVDVASTPDRYDAQRVVRWALDEPAETIVVAMPGLFGGAVDVAPLARRLVAARPGLQVWGIDRRANALEDHRAARIALASGDPSPLVGAYLGRDGAPPGFRAPDPEARGFVADWGLEVHLADLDVVVRAARAAAPRVVLLGHSMGASMAAVYAAWETDRGPGGTQLDGLVLVDGAPGRTGAFGLERGFRLAGLPVVLPSRAALAAGDVDPWVTLGEGGATFARRMAAAQLAALDPEGDAPAGALPYPASNRAFAGVLHDDQYGPFEVFNASLGEAVGAELDGNLVGFLLGGPWAARSASLVGVAPDAERVTWGPGDPWAERSDMDEYLDAWTLPDVDASEWYMPLRLLQDLTALSPDLRDVPGFVPMARVATPTLAIGSDRGLLRDADAFAGYLDQRLGAPVSVTIVAGLTHVDLLTADENPVVPRLLRWLALLP